MKTWRQKLAEQRSLALSQTMPPAALPAAGGAMARTAPAPIAKGDTSWRRAFNGKSADTPNDETGVQGVVVPSEQVPDSKTVEVDESDWEFVVPAELAEKLAPTLAATQGDAFLDTVTEAAKAAKAVVQAARKANAGESAIEDAVRQAVPLFVEAMYKAEEAAVAKAEAEGGGPAAAAAAAAAGNWVPVESTTSTPASDDAVVEALVEEPEEQSVGGADDGDDEPARGVVVDVQVDVWAGSGI